LPILKLFTL